MSMPTLTLTVNTNSYVTLEQASTLVASYFSPNSPEYTSWASATAATQTAVLINACLSLNNLRYKGAKQVPGQLLAFPRIGAMFPGVIYIPFISPVYDNTLYSGNSDDTGINAASAAQCVSAATMLSQDTNMRADIIDRTSRGLRSRRMPGGISEDYSGTTDRVTAVVKGIYGWDQVQYILNGWLTESLFAL